ncbi:hypothetical protein HNQ08_003616 [Deinococcus humi]|uniref:Uncharacterized protein n=1 Tax=Deinococcus humi TaxID=662880 RepID=A0A7W8JYZ2_9DEIO|nr:hypothetical protein [Deinococcus humi]
MTWLQRLNDQEQAEINKWMGRRPEALKKAVDQG